MTYYEIMELSESASAEVIKMAYKALTKKYHPDIFEGDPLVAEEKMKAINYAYSVLSNPAKRANYDEHLRQQRASSYRTKYSEPAVPTNSSGQQQDSAQYVRKKHSLLKAVCAVVLAIVFSTFCWIIIENTRNTDDIREESNKANQQRPNHRSITLIFEARCTI